MFRVARYRQSVLKNALDGRDVFEVAMSDRGGSAGSVLRWQPASWRDPRLVIGVVLVVASILGVVLLVRSVTRTETYMVAAHDLAPGTVLTEKDLVPVEARLAGPGERYVSRDVPVAGATVSDYVSKGELLTRRAIESDVPAHLRSFSLTVEGPLPAGVKVGQGVDVYVTPKIAEPETEPQLALSGVRVVKVERADSGFGASQGHVLEVLIPRDEVSAKVGHIARESVVSVVSAPIAASAAGE